MTRSIFTLMNILHGSVVYVCVEMGVGIIALWIEN